jgi:hypothetical protein
MKQTVSLTLLFSVLHSSSIVRVTAFLLLHNRLATQHAGHWMGRLTGHSGQQEKSSGQSGRAELRDLHAVPFQPAVHPPAH